jgi:hypothetical protein
MLHGVGRSGWKSNYKSNWGLIYRNRSIYIVNPHLCSHSLSACTMRSLTATSAPTLCLINTNAWQHSFPIICELISPSLLMVPLSHSLSTGSDCQFIPSSEPGGRQIKPGLDQFGLICFIFMESSVMAVTWYLFLVSPSRPEVAQCFFCIF